MGIRIVREAITEKQNEKVDEIKSIETAPRRMVDMGMTDRQFNGFVRFLLDDIQEAIEESSEEKRKAKLLKVVKNLQTTLED